MSSAQPAFGGMFRQLIELGVVEVNTEPLDARIERRLKEFWENTSCPRCGHQSIERLESFDRRLTHVEKSLEQMQNDFRPL